MSNDARHEAQGNIERSYPGEPEQPNAAEVSGTSFPLLSTVLAGFAITTTVQLVIGTDGADGIPARVVAALVMIMLSALLFLSSTGFALNAQANNYLPFLELGQTGRKLLHIEDHAGWILRTSRRWKRFYSAAVFFFFLGVLLLLAGVNLIVWHFAGGTLALALLAGIVGNVVLIASLTSILNRDSEEPQSVHPVAPRDPPKSGTNEASSEDDS